MAIGAELRTPFLIVVAVASTAALAACGGIVDQPSNEPGRSAGPVATSAPPHATASDGGASAEPRGGGVEGVASAIAAIELAESETGATAYEIEGQDDDRSWEVELADGTEQLTVLVSGDGASVLSTAGERDVEEGDRAALDAASITLVEAIEAAVAEIGGGASFDDVSLEGDDSDGEAWQVSFEDETDVFVSVSDGAILRVD
jgi:uncharacterized membrane protein YkoI